MATAKCFPWPKMCWCSQRSAEQLCLTAAHTQWWWLILSHALFSVSYYQLIGLCHQPLNSATRQTLNRAFLETVPFAIGLGKYLIDRGTVAVMIS